MDLKLIKICMTLYQERMNRTIDTKNKAGGWFFEESSKYVIPII